MLKSIKSSEKIAWEVAPDIRRRVAEINQAVGGEYSAVRIFCFRSHSAKTRAIARIWGLSKIWQLALGQRPAYIIEVIAEKFDRLSENQKRDVLIHELAHIPKNLSGALVPHYRRGKRKFTDLIKKISLAYDHNSR